MHRFMTLVSIEEKNKTKFSENFRHILSYKTKLVIFLCFVSVISVVVFCCGVCDGCEGYVCYGCCDGFDRWVWVMGIVLGRVILLFSNCFLVCYEIMDF